MGERVASGAQATNLNTFRRFPPIPPPGPPAPLRSNALESEEYFRLPGLRAVGWSTRHLSRLPEHLDYDRQQQGARECQEVLAPVRESRWSRQRLGMALVVLKPRSTLRRIPLGSLQDHHLLDVVGLSVSCGHVPLTRLNSVVDGAVCLWWCCILGWWAVPPAQGCGVGGGCRPPSSGLRPRGGLRFGSGQEPVVVELVISVVTRTTQPITVIDTHPWHSPSRFGQYLGCWRARPSWSEMVLGAPDRG